jgi:hypothetical protein
VLHTRVPLAELPQQLPQADAGKGIAGQIDHVDAPGGIVQDLVHGGVDAQGRLSRGEQLGVVVAQPVHRPGAQAGNEAEQAVLASDAGRPAKLVPGKSDSGEGREEIFAGPAAHHRLNHDSHFFVEVEQPPLGPVLDGVRAVDGGVDFGNRVEQGVQPLFLVALVGQEQAFIFSGESRSQTIFQEA